MGRKLARMTAITFQRLPQRIAFQEKAGFKDTYGGALGWVSLQGLLLKPDRPSDTLLISMHPIGGTSGLPVMSLLAARGLHVLACDSRYRGADYALIMEKVVLDLGAVVRHAREKLGYAKVVLLGWSGGGSLSAFYQGQAERPSITATPAGDPVDLVGADLIPADGLVFMAAHVSRHRLLTESLDPSIFDEADPDRRDETLDLYHPERVPPFDAAFLEHYRAAQEARMRRITAMVKTQLDDLRRKGRPNEERGFLVHGTMADPRWIDASLEPSDREPGSCYLGDPQIVNMSPIGLGRYSSLRSWLSQWSLDDAQGDGPENLAKTSVPTLVVNNSADNACAPSHAQRLYNAVPHDDRTFHEIKGATHYYSGQPDLGRQAVKVLADWLHARHFDQ
jgi:pimeloyl-ACP methyl ester carboxylesterase